MEKAKTNKRPAIGWSLGFAYLSTVLLLVLSALLVLATTLCNAKYMQSQVGKSSFNNAAYNLLKDNYASYASATGFDSAVLTDVLNPEQIRADMEQSVTNMYAGQTAFNERAEVGNAAYAAMKADIESRGMEVTDTVESGIAIVADACRSDYADYVSVPLASQLYTAILKVKSVLWIGIVLAALFGAAAFVLMVRLAPNARVGVRCLAFVFIAATMLCLIVALFLYPALHLGDLKLEPTSLRLFLLSYIRGMFGQFGLFAAVYGLIAAALLALTGMARTNAKQRIRISENR